MANGGCLTKVKEKVDPGWRINLLGYRNRNMATEPSAVAPGQVPLGRHLGVDPGLPRSALC